MMFLLFLLACVQSAPLSEQMKRPVPIATAECEVCGMLVAEQPAPRGQVVYRDGTHAFTCSLQGLFILVSSPNPRGQPVEVYVEKLDPDFDWTQSPVGAFPWVAAEEAVFVAGAQRNMVMGTPLLSYGDVGAASRAAKQLGTSPYRWSELSPLIYQK
jgi:nitrous oxide reductase accessory protein NosL